MNPTHDQQQKLHALFIAIADVLNLVLQEVKSRHTPTAPSPPVLPATQPRPAEPDEHRLWTVTDVARFLSASKSWVYKEAEKGTLPAIRLGAMLRFEPEEVRRFAGVHVGANAPAGDIQRRTARRRPQY